MQKAVPGTGGSTVCGVLLWSPVIWQTLRVRGLPVLSFLSGDENSKGDSAVLAQLDVGFYRHAVAMGPDDI